MASIDSLISSIARLADSCAGDMQALLVSHPNHDTVTAPHMASAYSALEALQTSLVQLRASVRDAETNGAATLSDTLRTSVSQGLEACHGQATSLFKQVMRLSMENMDDTNERFWTVLNVFVGAHVKLFKCYAGIIPLTTTAKQDERLHALVSQEVIHQASHAVRLAKDAPDIFMEENTTSHPALPYRDRADAELPGYDVPPSYQAEPHASGVHVTVSSHWESSHNGEISSGSNTSTTKKTWSKLKTPVKQFSKAMRDQFGNPTVSPLVNDLCAAAASGNAKHVEGLIEQGADVDGISAQNNTALCLAAEYNYTAVAKILLAAGASASFHSPHTMPPVFIAAGEGHIELAKLLLEHGATVTARDIHGQPFVVRLVQDSTTTYGHGEGASGSGGIGGIGTLKGLQFLLQHGANADARDVTGRTPIVHAVMTNDVPMATILLAFGADPNAKDITGRPLLVQAILNRNLQLVRFLLDNGADANCKDMTGASVLAIACEHFVARNDTVTLLLRRGAVPDSKTVVGVTVFADAVVRRKLDLARVLLEYGASPVATEVTGQPIIITVIQSKKILLEDKLDLLKMMLDRGASVYAVDFVLGNTALSIARQVEGKKVVQLLESYAN